MDPFGRVRFKAATIGVFAVALGALLSVPAVANEPEHSCSASESQPWKFGIMADTQWKANQDGVNPGTSAIGIINQLNRQFIAEDVEFVIQAGDLADKETDSPNGSTARTMGLRAAAAQSLYEAGIGFFPLRGNHEGSATAAVEFQGLFPQTTGAGEHVVGARSFSSPFPTLSGLSYSFDYRNARFVLLDQFTRTDNTNYLGSSNNNVIDQLDWIRGTLADKPRRSHAFVFAHKGLITANHTDTLFGSTPASNPDAQNTFMSALSSGGVRYLFNGHDHVHNRAVVKSPDSKASVQNITASSNSYKFYVPKIPSNDAAYNNPTRETEIAQELFTIGYYIVTVDGPKVNVDFYSAPNGCNGDCDLVTTPMLNPFTKRESFGYSMNGKEFLVAQGQSYTAIADDHSRTTARILSGTNDSTGTDFAARPLSQVVNTGWTEGTCQAASDVLSLWGMRSILGSVQTPTFTLSMSYDHHAGRHADLEGGRFGLATRVNGKWVNAVDMNIGANYGGARKFVYGPWAPGYTLGTYGVDPVSHTVWAVINYNADFAAAQFPAAERKHPHLSTRPHQD